HEPRPIPTWLAFASDSDRARRVATPPNGGALYDKRLESCFLDNISCGQQSEISLAEFEGCTDDGFAGAGDAIAMGSRHLFDQAVGAQQAQLARHASGHASLVGGIGGNWLECRSDIPIAGTVEAKLTAEDGLKQRRLLGADRSQRAIDASIVRDPFADRIEQA